MSARKTDLVQQFPHALAPGRRALAQTVDLQRLVDDAAHRHARIERRERVLKDDLNIAAQPAALRRRRGGNVLALKSDGARSRLLQPENQTSERRFSATALADETERLALANGQAHLFDSTHKAGLAPDSPADLESLGELLETHDLFRAVGGEKPRRRRLGGNLPNGAGSDLFPTMAGGKAAGIGFAQMRRLRAGGDGKGAARRETAAGRRVRKIRRQTLDGRQTRLARPCPAAGSRAQQTRACRDGAAPRRAFDGRAAPRSASSIHDRDLDRQRSATTPRSWVIRIIAMSSSRAGRRSVRGSAPGSSRRAPWSARRRSAARDRSIRPMAIITRWRMPPDNWCGYWPRRRVRIGDTDEVEQFDRFFAHASDADDNPREMDASVIWPADRVGPD
jgi:hypothetical protein